MRAVPSAVRAFSAIVLDAAKTNRTEQPSFYHVLCGNAGQWRVGSTKCQEPGGLITSFLSRQVRCNPCFQPISAEAAMGQNVTALMSCLLQDACQSLCEQPLNGWDNSHSVPPAMQSGLCFLPKLYKWSCLGSYQVCPGALRPPLCVSALLHNPDILLCSSHRCCQITSLIASFAVQEYPKGPVVGQPQRACPVQAPGVCGPAQQLGGGPAVQAGQAGHAQPVALRCPGPAVQV